MLEFNQMNNLTTPLSDDSLQVKSDSVLERYIIHEQLGGGNTNVVYRAYDKELKIDVAILFSIFIINPDWSSDSVIYIAKLLKDYNMAEESFSFPISWAIVDRVPVNYEDIPDSDDYEEGEISQYMVYTLPLYERVDLTRFSKRDIELMKWELVHNYTIAQQRLDWIHGDINSNNIMMRRRTRSRTYITDIGDVVVNTEYSLILIDYSDMPNSDEDEQEYDYNNLIRIIKRLENYNRYTLDV